MHWVDPLCEAARDIGGVSLARIANVVAWSVNSRHKEGGDKICVGGTFMLHGTNLGSPRRCSGHGGSAGILHIVWVLVVQDYVPPPGLFWAFCNHDCRIAKHYPGK